MKAEDIETADDLKAWLNGLPEDQVLQIAPQIAHRAAMRVLPIWARYCASRPNDLTVIPFFRCHAISHVASRNHGAVSDIGLSVFNSAALAAEAAAEDSSTLSSISVLASLPSLSTPSAASDSASTAVRACASANVLARVDTVGFSVAAGHSAASEFAGFSNNIAAAARAATAADAFTVEQGEDLTKLPLWPDAADPLAEVWTSAEPLFERHPAWQVFKDLYENTLHARPQNWPLLTALAQKDEAFWTGTDEVVLDRIAGVVEEFERHRLLEETKALKSAIEAALPEGAAPEFKRSHNNPPELIEDAEPPAQVLIIWAGLDDVEHELEQEKPDKERLKSIALWLRRIALGITFVTAPVWGGFGAELGKDIYLELGVRERLSEYVEKLLEFADQ